MIRRPPRSTRTDTLFPYTTLFRSITGKYPLPAGPSSQDFTVTLFSALRPLAFCSLLLATPSIATEQPPAAETAQAEIPDGFSLESDGTTLVHVASGLRFPAEFAGYTRLRERAFDPGGEYIAGGYDRPLARKRVGEGRRVEAVLDLGGRRFVKK